MFGEDAYEDQFKWYEKTLFPVREEPKEVVKLLQEISESLELHKWVKQ